MQPQTPNMFPVSDGNKSKDPIPPVSAPMPAPIPDKTASSPRSMFTQPTTQNPTTGEPRSTGLLSRIETIGARLFSHPALQLPDYARDMISAILPWMTIMMCVIILPLVIAGLALGGFLGFITSFYEINQNPFYWIAIALLIAQLVLMLMAVPKLLHESRQGWSLLFTAALLDILLLIANTFAQFVPPVIALGWGIPAFFVILYVLFQTRSFYTK